MPPAQKVAVLTEEGVRMLRNTSKNVVLKEKEAIIRQYNIRLFEAGHDEKYRAVLTDKVLWKYEKHVEHGK